MELWRRPAGVDKLLETTSSLFKFYLSGQFNFVLFWPLMSEHAKYGLFFPILLLYQLMIKVSIWIRWVKFSEPEWWMVSIIQRYCDTLVFFNTSDFSLLLLIRILYSRMQLSLKRSMFPPSIENKRRESEETWLKNCKLKFTFSCSIPISVFSTFAKTRKTRPAMLRTMIWELWRVS